jgi:hypothetical protein
MIREERSASLRARLRQLGIVPFFLSFPPLKRRAIAIRPLRGLCGSGPD